MFPATPRRGGGGRGSSLTLIAAVVDLGGLCDLGWGGLWWHGEGRMDGWMDGLEY